MSVLVADLPLGPGPTRYTRLGDVPPWTSVLLALLIGAVALRPKAAKAA
jgi:apolipoprotein N-acyltransferase